MLKTILNKIEETILENLLKSFLILYTASIASFVGVSLVLKPDLSENALGINKNNNIEITSEDESNSRKEKIQVEISGAVNNPGVFELVQDSRLISLLNMAGGFSSQASREWITKNINLSSKLEDSQKVYVPYIWDTASINTVDEAVDLVALVKPIVSTPIVESSQDDTTSSDTQENTTLINVNRASQEDIDSLPGIGPVYAARIIENRPYDDLPNFEEVSGVPGGVIDDIKNLITF